MEALGAAASVLTIIELAKAVYSSCHKYMLGVKHARKEIQRLSAEVLALRDVLESVDELLKSSSASKLPTLSLLQKPDGAFQQCKHQLEDILGKLEPVDGMRAVGARALKWPFRSEKVNDAIDVLERQKTTIELALNTDHVAETINVGRAVTRLHDDLSTARIQENETRISREDKELRDKVVGWLKSTDPSTNHMSQRRKCQATTGEWFVKGKELKEWLQKPNALLWLHGTSGCGKTVLSSTIIEHIKDNHLADQTVAMAYYYFDFNDPEKQKAINLVSSVISQLCAQRASLCSPVRDLYKRSHEGNNKPLLHELLQTLGSMIEVYHTVYIVIDALDECPHKDGQRDELLQILEEIHKRNMTQLRILVTSRRESEISDVLEPLLTESAVCIQSGRVDADIQLHVQNELRDLAKKKRWSTDLVTKIQEVLVNGANGMFRWISCQLDTLKQCLTPNQVHQKLKSLPKNLEDTYARILLELPEDYREDACTALRWLCYSERPLYLEELVEALLLRPNKDPPFDPEDRLSDPHAVLQILPGLVSISTEIDEESEADQGSELDEDLEINEEWESDETSEAHEKLKPKEPQIRLAHFSVKEYLVGNNIGKGPTAVFGTTPEHAHQFITESCLVYILAYHKAKERMDSAQDLNRFPLLLYSCRFWYVHRRAFAGKDKMPTGVQTHTNEMIMQILLSVDKSKSWLQVYTPGSHPLTFSLVTDAFRRPFESDLSTIQYGLHSSLYYAASIGLYEAVEHLLDHGVNPDDRPRGYGTCLCIAAHKGETKICQLLLSRGASVDIEGMNKHTPLWFAASAGQTGTVHLLLKNDAHVDAGAGTDEYTALHAAASHGHQEVVRALLESGAYVNAVTKQGTTALDYVARQGTGDMARLLLDFGADVEGSNSHGWTPLLLATLFGEVDCVDVLQERGANLAAKMGETSFGGTSFGGAGRTSLHWAARDGSYAIVKKLLDLHVDIETVDDAGETPLLLVVEVIRPASRLGHDGMEYMHRSSEKRDESEDVIRLLLEHGANIHARNKNGATPLHSAVRTYESTARLLLEHGADIHARTKTGETPLHKLAYGGSEEIARLLLEFGANVHARDDTGATPLHRIAATAKGPESIARLFIQHGANVHTQDSTGATPLHTLAKAAKGSESIARLLLQHRANVDTQDSTGAAPLHRSVKIGRGSESITKLLLEHGANVHMKDNAGATPLHKSVASTRLYGQSEKEIWVDPSSIAEERALESVMKVLLQNGADIDAKDTKSATPLQYAVQSGEQGTTRRSVRHGVYTGGYVEKGTVRLLLEHGANVDAKDDAMLMPRDLAAQNGHTEILAILRSANLDSGLGS